MGDRPKVANYLEVGYVTPKITKICLLMQIFCCNERMGLMILVKLKDRTRLPYSQEMLIEL
jgi:hypothetical protein